MTATAKLETLQRLVTLYAVVEEMHAVELQRMTAAVEEAEQAIGLEQKAAQSARSYGRRALAAGDAVGRMLAHTQHETAAWRRRRIEVVRHEREELNSAAREQYVASRLKREQMTRVLEDIASRKEIEESRRTQAASDDRFLARRRWSDLQQQNSSCEHVKRS